MSHSSVSRAFLLQAEDLLTFAACYDTKLEVIQIDKALPWCEENACSPPKKRLFTGRRNAFLFAKNIPFHLPKNTHASLWTAAIPRAPTY